MPKPPPPADWHGFHSPRYTQTPDDLFDELLRPGLLTEAELRVLLYLIRRTFGFKKDSDAVSLTQFTDGIVRADGTRLDWGAGVQRKAVGRAIQGLERKGIIVAERATRPSGENVTTVYRLVMADSPKDPTVASQRPYGSVPTALPVESPGLPQDTASTDNGQEEGSAVPAVAALRRRNPPAEAFQAGTVPSGKKER